MLLQLRVTGSMVQSVSPINFHKLWICIAMIMISIPNDTISGLSNVPTNH